jgi:hypothetical protein
MKSLMQCALADDWEKLPPALQAHYRFGTTTDIGHMDIEFPRFMQPYLSVLRLLGALVHRRGHQLSTVVEKSVVGHRQNWRRTITYPDRKVVRFNSFWVAAKDHQLIEFVNPIVGLQMAVHVRSGRLHYHGVSYIIKLGALMLPIPEWLVLGHTTIVEEAVDESHFKMDFRLTHPLLGQVFRYSGEFEATCQLASQHDAQKRGAGELRPRC